MNLYTQVSIAFAGIASAAIISSKTKSFPRPFYILSGILLGPSVLNLVSDEEVIRLFAEIGEVFMFYYLGSRFSLKEIAEKKKEMFFAGSIDFVINFGIGFFAAILLGLGFFASFVLAGIIYMSSSAAIRNSLIQLHSNKDPISLLVNEIVVYEDLVMVVFLAVISTITRSDIGISYSILDDLGVVILFCVAILLMGRWGHHFLEVLLGFESREIVPLVFLAFILLMTAMGLQMGISTALSAFFLGLAFSGIKNAKKIGETMTKFRDIFGSVFFFSFGIRFHPEALSLSVFVLGFVVLAAYAGKLVSAQLITYKLSLGWKKGWLLGVASASRGEFTLLIASIAATETLDLTALAIIIVLSTTMTSTFILRLSNYLCKNYGLCLLADSYEE